jgi:zinc transporter ZupT
VIVSKKGIIIAILLGIILPLVLFVSTLILFPNQIPIGTPIPKPETGFEPLFLAIMQLGLAAAAAMIIVVIILMTNRAHLQLRKS